LFGRPYDQSIPEGKPVKPVEIDGGENVGHLGHGHVELGEQFDFSARR